MCMARLSACRAVHQQETNKRLAITAFQLSGQFSTSRKSPRPFVSELCASQPERENFDNVCAGGVLDDSLVILCACERQLRERYCHATFSVYLASPTEDVDITILRQ